jgi:cytochrome b involved in lipid metabolism
MKKYLIIGLVFVALIAVGVYLIKPNSTANLSVTPTPDKIITLEEVARHNNANSCYMVIDGNVYDVTAYIPRHANNQILDGCGKDASLMFGRERKHAVKGRALLPEYIIGTLAK